VGENPKGSDLKGEGSLGVSSLILEFWFALLYR